MHEGRRRLLCDDDIVEDETVGMRRCLFFTERRLATHRMRLITIAHTHAHACMYSLCACAKSVGIHKILYAERIAHPPPDSETATRKHTQVSQLRQHANTHMLSKHNWQSACKNLRCSITIESAATDSRRPHCDN